MQILSRIYDLLSQCSTDELRQASKLTGDASELSEAIYLLAAFKQKSAHKGGPKSAGRRGPSSSYGPTKRSRITKSSTNGLSKKLSDVVLTKEYFHTNQQLAKFLRELKVPIKIDAKDSRKRVLIKLQNWLDNLPQEEQRNAYIELLRVLPPSETAGWFDAIRSSQS